MNKFFRRILGIIFTLILWCPQFCYADVISGEELTFSGITFLVGLISVNILITSAISFFSLKATVKKQNKPGYDNEKLESLSQEEIEKRKNKLQRKFYVWGMILAIIVLMILALNNTILKEALFIPIIWFIVSIIFRINKDKKVSNIIWAITVALVCLMVVASGIARFHNDQYQEYKYGLGRETPDFYSYYNISTTEDLINTLIENNKIGIKTTIIYQDVKYTSPEELKQLLNKFELLENNEKFSKYHYYVTWNVQYGKILHYVKAIELFYKDN